jgi:hypothetical protein
MMANEPLAPYDQNKPSNHKLSIDKPLKHVKIEQYSTVCVKTKTPKKIQKISKSQKWTSYPTDTRKNPRLKNHEAPKKKKRSTKVRSRECDAST